MVFYYTILNSPIYLLFKKQIKMKKIFLLLVFFCSIGVSKAQITKEMRNAQQNSVILRDWLLYKTMVNDSLYLHAEPVGETAPYYEVLDVLESRAFSLTGIAVEFSIANTSDTKTMGGGGVSVSYDDGVNPTVTEFLPYGATMTFRGDIRKPLKGNITVTTTGTATCLISMVKLFYN